jgi:hypothetical protein
MDTKYKKGFLEEINRIKRLMVNEDEKRDGQQPQATVPAHLLFKDTKRYRMEWYSHDDEDNYIVCQLAGKPKDYDKILRVITDMDFPGEGYRVTSVDTVNPEEWDSSILHYRHYDPEKPVIKISYEYDADLKRKHQRRWW